MILTCFKRLLKRTRSPNFVWIISLRCFLHQRQNLQAHSVWSMIHLNRRYNDYKLSKIRCYKSILRIKDTNLIASKTRRTCRFSYKMMRIKVNKLTKICQKEQVGSKQHHFTCLEERWTYQTFSTSVWQIKIKVRLTALKKWVKSICTTRRWAPSQHRSETYTLYTIVTIMWYRKYIKNCICCVSYGDLL